MRFFRSLKYAIQGIRHCALSEKNFRIQMCLAIITFFFGIALKISVNEWFAVLFYTALVLSLEMVNTVVEKLSDTITKSLHPVIKQVKDIAAGAVCLVSIISLITGCVIFLPKLIFFIKYFLK